MKLTKEQIENAIQDHESKIQELQEQLKKSSYVTGFERVKENTLYSCVSAEGDILTIPEGRISKYDDIGFNIANYGSEKRMSLLEKMNRLQRLLYRFSAENGGDKINWSDENQEKWFIGYNAPAKEHAIDSCFFIEYTNVIHFTSLEVAEQALEQFRPLMEEIIKEEQEVREYYLELNSKEKLTSPYKFPVGREFIIDGYTYKVIDIFTDDGTIDGEISYEIECDYTDGTCSSETATESELSEIILRGSFNE